MIPLGQPVPKGGGIYQIGKPYQVAGVWYTPREQPGYDQVGSASWYGELFHGRRTANGEIYDMDRLSAAHPTLPLPVYARVTNLNNGRTIVVRINDRGPYANDRIIDLSRRSAELLGFRNHGTATVRVKYLARAPLNGDDSYERKYLASQSWVQFAAKGKSPDLAVGSIAEQGDAAGRESGESWRCHGRRLCRSRRHRSGQIRPLAEGGARPPRRPACVASDHGLNSAQRQGPRPRSQAAGTPHSGGLVQEQGQRRPRPHRASPPLRPVEVSQIDGRRGGLFPRPGGAFCRRVGGQAALVKVTAAGYRGAKVLRKN